MSSRDIGPQLPPNMRRSRKKFGDSDGDRQSMKPFVRDRGDDRRERNSDRYHSKDEKDRNRSWDRDWDRARDRDRERDRGRDRERVKDRDRNRDREWERAKGRERDRERSSRNEESTSKSPTGDRRRGKIVSKRSKTDRTYNTDTEESSDDQDGIHYKRALEHKSLSVSPGQSENEPEEKDLGLNNYNQIGTESGVLEPTASLCSDRKNRNVEAKQRGSCEKQDKSECGGNEFPHQTISACSSEGGEGSIGPALPPHLVNRHSKLPEQGNQQIGPVLPPHLKRVDGSSDDSDSECVTHVESCAPPQQLQKEGQRINDGIGSDGDNLSTGSDPTLPKHLQRVHKSHSKAYGSDSDENEKPVVSCPSLPPHLIQREEEDVGPALPPGFKSPVPAVVGPSLPPGMRLKVSENEDDDDEVVGPLLPEQLVRSGKNYIVQSQLERNAAEVRRRLEGKDEDNAIEAGREKWMLELPPEGTVDLGLGPRTFRIRGAPEKGADRSSWTDTPADKARKEEEAKKRFEQGLSSTSEIQEIGSLQALSSRDKSMEDEVKKHSKKRSKESLLEAHQKKIMKKKKKEEEAGKKQERRPFNREIDLKTNVFDDAQKKAIFKKAQFLDSRFSRGESKYL